MFSYQIQVVIKENKVDEFVQSMGSFSPTICKEKGCLDFSVYRDTEKENSFSVIGEWRTRQAMEKHFKNKNFEVLVGAAKVLGETFRINIVESQETGGFKLAREKIALLPQESRATPG